MELSIKIGKTTFKNPVFVASGTFGYGEEMSEIFNIEKLGAIVTKGLTLKPRQGFDGLRIVETPAGVINRIGLQNVGIDEFIKNKMRFLSKLKTRIIVNIAGETIEEYKIITEKLDKIKRVDAIEVNVSCPNVEKGGITFSENEKIFKKLLKIIRRTTKKTLIAKLSPSAGDIVHLSKITEKTGFDGITISNTFKATVIDTETGRIKITGGLSGPAIYPIALNNVLMVTKKVDIPVIGCGGIYNTDVALQFLIAGAVAIQIGTFNFIQPDIGVEIIKGIKEFSKRAKFKFYSEPGTVGIVGGGKDSSEVVGNAGSV